MWNKIRVGLPLRTQDIIKETLLGLGKSQMRSRGREIKRLGSAWRHYSLIDKVTQTLVPSTFTKK